VAAVTLSSPDTRALATFYERLLGWTRVDDSGAWIDQADWNGVDSS
jgi:catechol 2,3-dioxygenase-like lactoylglutathione lyase family enzyme